MAVSLNKMREDAVFRLVVRESDTIESLAVLLGIDLSQLIEANPELSSQDIFPGQHLSVPARIEWITTDLASPGRLVPAPGDPDPGPDVVVDALDIVEAADAQPEMVAAEGTADADDVGAGGDLDAADEAPPGDGGDTAQDGAKDEEDVGPAEGERTDEVPADAGDLVPPAEPEVAPQADEPSSPGEAPNQPVVWKPFPKPTV